MSPVAAADEHTRPQTELEAVDALAVLDSSRELKPGMRLGPYRLVRTLGQGGMGQVWLAEQQEPLLRLVALKLQKQRLSGGMSEAYFQVERQALAKLVHPYIAQIHDAGTLPDGALYFAMEYIDGQTLDRFVAGRKLGLDATVGLLVRICQGVQHAHQRGLIHRDLKPGNILVMEVGGQPIPKIIDFGVAIGIDPRSGVAQTQRRAGTRAYMAPEQNVPTAEGIDVRADVHALGTLLAECVCLSMQITLDLLGSDRMRSLLATTPFDPDMSAPDAGARALPGSRAIRRIPAELRAIALKAMALDRNQRYESAAALADDLERWRAARPVRAMGQGRWYAVRCFVRRYRIATAAGVLVFLALVAGLVTAMYGLREAQSARALAEERRDKAEQLIGYMLGSFADKLRQLGKLELLDGVSSEAMKYLAESHAAGDSSLLFRARALRTLAEVNAARGQYDRASAALADAELLLGPQPGPAVDASEWWLERGNLAYWRGYARYQVRDLDGAERHWRIYEAAAQQLVPLTRASGKGLLEASYTHNNLGTLAFERGRFAEAERYFRLSIDEKQAYLLLRPDDTEVLEGLSDSHSWMGRAYENQSQLRAANAEYRRQVAFAEQVVSLRGADAAAQSRLAYARVWLASSALDLGESAEAIRLLEQARDQLDKLVAFDAGQRQWQEMQATAVAELWWTRWLASGAAPSASDLACPTGAGGAEGLRAQRMRIRCQLRRAILGMDSARMAALQATMAGASADWLASTDPVDVRLRQALVLEWRVAGGTMDALKPGWQQVLLPLAMPATADANFRDLDLRARLAWVEGSYAALPALRERLRTMGYAHPDLSRFLKPHEETQR